MQHPLFVQKNCVIAYQQRIRSRHASFAPQDLAGPDIQAHVGYACEVAIGPVNIVADPHYVTVMYSKLAVKPQFLDHCGPILSAQLQCPAAALVSAAEEQQIIRAPDQS